MRRGQMRIERHATGLPEGLTTLDPAVTRDGDRLVLGEVTPAEGWTAEEVDTETDEVEVEFRNGPDELDLEVEVEDDRRTAGSTTTGTTGTATPRTTDPDRR